MNFYFGEEGDVLDITFGKPRKAVAKELKNDIAVRVDPESGEVVGIVILNFIKRFRMRKRTERIELPVRVTITTR